MSSYKGSVKSTVSLLAYDLQQKPLGVGKSVYNKFMRLLFAISILLTSIQMASAQEEVLTPLQFQEGGNAYEVKAISLGLSNLIKNTFEHWFSESHFIYPPRCSSDVSVCRKNLDFEISFETASFDLNSDGKLEVIVYYNAPASCGSGGCWSYILEEELGSFRIIGEVFPGGIIDVSNLTSDGYHNLLYYGKDRSYSCEFQNDKKKYRC